MISRAATATILFAFAASPVLAQGPPPAPKWELEVHVGQTVVVNPIDGNQQTQPTGPFFSKMIRSRVSLRSITSPMT